MEAIKIRGARQHNLRNIDVEIPRGKLVVVTGVSGSGKSSLAFHTLYAEGQRRYVESLSTYARQFLDQLEKPEVDAIEGLSPAIALEQRVGGGNPRSIIATVTEIHDYLRILYAAIGVPHDPVTGEPLERMTSVDIIESLAGQEEGSKVILLAPVEMAEGVDVAAFLSDIQRQGFVRVRVNGELLEVEEAEKEWPEKLDSLEVVVDRLVVREDSQSRLADSVETALRICGNEARALVMAPGESDWKELEFQTSYRNAKTGFELPALSPKHFSFNSHVGACPECHGLGTELFCDPDLVVPDRSVSLNDQAVKVWTGKSKAKGKGQSKGWNQKRIDALAEHFGIDGDLPFRKLPKKFVQALFYGTGEEKIGHAPFEGICRQVERHFRDTTSEAVKRNMGRFMNSQPCQACEGKRLKPEFLAVKLPGNESLGIHEFCELPVEDSYRWICDFTLPAERADACGPVVDEVQKRLRFLEEVGLGYLTLDRTSVTLSGGEFQRIRLATQLGAGLSGVVYVLDEPSIGLHPQDTELLISALRRLRDLGNTIVVVEHDEEIIRAADWVIELGPKAGAHGGELVAEGSPADLAKVAASPTGKWLADIGEEAEEELPKRSRTERQLIIRGAREHNLQNIDVEIPLGCFVSVTGPSGSGKSTLIDTILRRALARHFHGAKSIPGEHDAVEGMEYLGKMVVVDQSALGKSPRSNPATYTGAFDLIRDLFSKLPLSRQRGYSAGRFSFNVKGGRCEKCQGGGAIRIDMHFLNDAYVPCDACDAKRYNRETLEVTYKGRSIADILNMTVEEAVPLFAPVPKLDKIVRALNDVGLGYVKLGQAANTLSGGEAQRVKLASELYKSSHEPVLYLLDEPTTGLHHDDVLVLLSVLQRLCDEGHSIVVIEHNLEVIAASDWVLDLGAGGGVHGGRLMAAGPPEVLEKANNSPTGKWLKNCEKRR